MSDFAKDTNVPTNDCISRQEAIDEIKEIYEWHDNVTKERIIEHFKHLPSAQQWTPVTEGLPKDLKPVNITYINEDPAPYYEHIKGIPFTATAIYYRGDWYWWSCTCADVLAEYEHSYSNSMDEGIEVTAWMPLPEPWKGEER